MMTPAKKPHVQPLPTEAELGILQILWERGPQTVREVYEALPDKKTGYTTVLKQMQVMADKGLVTRNERFRSHLYEASIQRESTQRRLIGEFLQLAFSGSAKNLVLGALASQPVSKDELKEIKQLIKKVEERQS